MQSGFKGKKRKEKKKKQNNTLTKLLKTREIFVILINFLSFFYSYIFERTHLKLAFPMWIYIYIYMYIYIIHATRQSVVHSLHFSRVAADGNTSYISIARFSFKTFLKGKLKKS